MPLLLLLLCLDSGCIIVVRAARQNANAKQSRMDADRAREVLREEVAAVRALILPEGASEGGATTSTAEQVQEQPHQAVDVCPPPMKKRVVRSTRSRYVTFRRPRAHICLINYEYIDDVCTCIYRMKGDDSSNQRPKRIKVTSRK